MVTADCASCYTIAMTSTTSTGMTTTPSGGTVLAEPECRKKADGERGDLVISGTPLVQATFIDLQYSFEWISNAQSMVL